jgi:Na+/proline symporter
VQLTAVDWGIVALYFLFNLAVGFYYKSRAQSSIDEFFLSGRNVPWWLAGTSMVATTFAADTPLAVTGMVAANGIAGNWLWWCFVSSGMLTVFFYARLWRRSGVTTDVEFAEIRYSGRPAAFLRGFRALYLGIPINCIILGWVNKAMVDILMLILGVTKLEALAIVIGLIVLTSFISTLSGLWGVLVTDLFQFAIKMGMVIVLAVFAVRAVGGMQAMKDKLLLIDAARGGAGGSVLNFVPDLHSAWMPLLTFLGDLVSGGRARRRRLHRAAHAERARRKAFASGDVVVQRGALRGAPVAVDPGGPRFADPISRAGAA